MPPVSLSTCKHPPNRESYDATPRRNQAFRTKRVLPERRDCDRPLKEPTAFTPGAAHPLDSAKKMFDRKFETGLSFERMRPLAAGTWRLAPSMRRLPICDMLASRESSALVFLHVGPRVFLCGGWHSTWMR